MPDSMLELQAEGGPRADSHAVTGVVSSFDHKQAAPEPPNLLAGPIALARATRRCDCAVALATGAAGGLEGPGGPQSATLHALPGARAVYLTLVPCCSRPMGVFGHA